MKKTESWLNQYNEAKNKEREKWDTRNSLPKEISKKSLQKKKRNIEKYNVGPKYD